MPDSQTENLGEEAGWLEEGGRGSIALIDKFRTSALRGSAETDGGTKMEGKQRKFHFRGR